MSIVIWRNTNHPVSQHCKNQNADIQRYCSKRCDLIVKTKIINRSKNDTDRRISRKRTINELLYTLSVEKGKEKHMSMMKSEMEG